MVGLSTPFISKTRTSELAKNRRKGKELGTNVDSYASLARWLAVYQYPHHAVLLSAYEKENDKVLDNKEFLLELRTEIFT